MKKIFLLILFLFLGCNESPTSVVESNEPTVILNAPDFQINPKQNSSGYPKVTKQTDDIFIITIEKQWQSLSRVEATYNKIYPGVICGWEAACNSTATYTYLGQTFPAPLINASSYFSNGKASTMVSFYDTFINDTVVVAGAVLSEDATKLYVDVVYFVVKLKN